MEKIASNPVTSVAVMVFFGPDSFVTSTKILTKDKVPKNHFVIISARVVASPNSWVQISSSGVGVFRGGQKFDMSLETLVAQCSVTPATVAATPPCSATPFQKPKFRCDTSRHRGGEVRHQNF